MTNKITRPLLAALTALILAACPKPDTGPALLSSEFATALPCDTLILKFSEPVTARDNKVFEVKAGTAARALTNAVVVEVRSVTPVDSTLRLLLARQIRASESVELEYKGGISSASGGGTFEPAGSDPVPVSPPSGGSGSTGGSGGSGGGGSSGGSGGTGGDTPTPAPPGHTPYAAITWNVAGASQGGVASGDTVTITADITDGGTDGSLTLSLQKSSNNSSWTTAAVSDLGGGSAASNSYTFNPWREHIGLYVRVSVQYTYTYIDANYPQNNEPNKTVSGAYTARIADRVATLAGTSCFVDLLPNGNVAGTAISITPEGSAAALLYDHASSADPDLADVYERNGTQETATANTWTYDNGAISVTDLTPNQDYTIHAAPYVQIGGRNLYMQEPGTIAYYVTPRQGLPTGTMSGIKVINGASQGKDSVTYPSTYSITITGSSPGAYALPSRDLSSEFSTWWDANHGGLSDDTTGCFNFTFAGGEVTRIDLVNSSPVGRIKASGFTGLTEVVLSGLDNGTLIVTGTPVFRIPVGAALYRGTIEIGYHVEYRNENQDTWGGLASDSTLRFAWGSTAYLNAADYTAHKPFIAPEWKGDQGQTFWWETMTVSNGSTVELKEDRSVRVDGKITAIRPYTLTGNWTLTGGSMFTIAIGSGNVFDVTGCRITGSQGALPIANSNIKHSSGIIRRLNGKNGSRSGDLTVSSEQRIYDWSDNTSTAGWLF